MFDHTPVLATEVVQQLTGGIGDKNIGPTHEPLLLVDCTLGGAGHAELLVKSLSEGSPHRKLHLVGFDQDPAARQAAQLRLEELGKTLPHFTHTLIDDNFCHLSTRLSLLPFWSSESRIDLLLADIGVSSPQLDDPTRGFSIRSTNPLDMRMNPKSTESAASLLQSAAEDELARIFFHFGEEPRSRKLARAIAKDREQGTLPTKNAAEFSAYVNRVLSYSNSRSNPSIRIFQALRIAVNRELDALTALLEQLPSLMNPSGRTGIISFHSLEDRITKKTLREWEEREPSLGCEFPRGGITGSEAECSTNPRARSARLRVFHWGKDRRTARRELKQLRSEEK